MKSGSSSSLRWNRGTYFRLERNAHMESTGTTARPFLELRWLIVVALTAWFYLFSAVVLAGCGAEYSTFKYISENPDLWKQNRGSITYFQRYPDEFAQRMATLGPNDHWIDAGAGEMYALTQYLNDERYRASYQVRALSKNWLLPSSKSLLARSRIVPLASQESGVGASD